MYGEDAQPVLRCGECNKPFDKQSTLKRHGYYCRSRRAGTNPRPRSCMSCVKRKTRCDNGRPECSRCMIKGIECNYPVNTRRDISPKSTQTSAVKLSSVEDHNQISQHQLASNDGPISLDGELVVSDMDFSQLGADYLGWNDIGNDFTGFWSLETSDIASEYPSSGLCSSSSTDQIIRSPPVALSPDLTMPALPTNAVRSLVPRPGRKMGQQRIANLILHTLKSYPLMMLMHNTLPPFIHASVLAPSVEHKNAEPLDTCISLMHMISSGVQGSRKLFWKNVGLECERLREEHPRLNRWELLAAIQALSVYLLVRLDEGQTDFNNVDALLIATVMAVSKQLACSDVVHNTQSTLFEINPKTNWRNWVFEESLRRVCVVYQVVNMLVYFEPAAMCEKPMNLVLSPLPAKKQLWEAPDALSWNNEIERGPEAHTSFGMATNGELYKMKGNQLHQTLDANKSSTSTGNWEEWCSGMDSFGGLIMLAASLIV